MFNNSAVINKLALARRAGSLNLDLSNCGLTELPPQLFEHHQNIRILNLGQNRLQCLPADIALLQQLVEINLQDNPLETLPDELALCQNLKYIDLDHTPRMEKQIQETYNHSLPAPLTCVITRQGRCTKPLMALLNIRRQRGPSEPTSRLASPRAAGTLVARQPIVLNEWGTVGAAKPPGRRHLSDQPRHDPIKPPPPSMYEMSPTHAGKRCVQKSNSNINAMMIGDDSSSFRIGKRVPVTANAPHMKVVGAEWGSEMEDVKPRRLRETKSNITSYGLVKGEEPRPRAKHPVASNYSINEWGAGAEPEKINKRTFVQQTGGSVFVDGAYVPTVVSQKEVGTKLKKHYEAHSQLDLTGAGDSKDSPRRVARRVDRMRKTTATGFLLNYGKTAQQEYENRLPEDVKAERTPIVLSARRLTPEDLGNMTVLPTKDLPVRGGACIDTALTGLRSGNGRLQFQALNDVRAVACHDAASIARKLSTIVPQVNSLVLSNIVPLASNAMMCVQDLCIGLGRSMTAYVCDIVSSLLMQATHTNPQLSEGAREVLSTIARVITPFSLFAALFDAVTHPNERVGGWACYTMREALFTNPGIKSFLTEGVTNTNIARCGEALVVLSDAADGGVAALAVDTLNALAGVIPGSHKVVLHDFLRQCGRQDLLQAS